MTKEEILHLSGLARIRLTDKEVEKFNTEIDAIIGYVSTINDTVADNDLTKAVGARFNIFREDEITNEPNEHTEALLNEMPEKDGRHLKVKKILNTEG